MPVYSIVTQPTGFLAGRALSEPSFWGVSLLAFYAFPDVLNIGFSRAWKPWRLRSGLILLALLLAGVGWMTQGSPFAPPLAVLLTTWLLYVFGHLGVSFLLAAIIGTPGCEMRAVPQLIARLRGRSAQEHYCPGLMTPLDRWEAGPRAT